MAVSCHIPAGSQRVKLLPRGGLKLLTGDSNIVTCNIYPARHRFSPE